MYNVSMLIVTSPAKTLDFSSPFLAPFETQPNFTKEASEIMNKLKSLKKEELTKLFEVSSEIAETNYERFQKWEARHTKENSRPAIVAYNGDIFEQIHENEYSEQQATYLQNSLRIISGLYGVLRPYDLIQPYRLEMRIHLTVDQRKNLYEFWDGKITDFLNKDIEKHENQYLINLASEEYGRVINPEKLRVPMINIIFNQQKNGKIVNYGLLARKARGMMIDYMIKNQVYDIKQLKDFTQDSYKLIGETSSTLLFMKEL